MNNEATIHSYKSARRIAEVITQDELCSLILDGNAVTIYQPRVSPRVTLSRSVSTSLLAGVYYSYRSRSNERCEFVSYDADAVFEFTTLDRIVRIEPTLIEHDALALKLGQYAPVVGLIAESDEVGELVHETIAKLDRLIELAECNALRVGSDIHFLIDAREALIASRIESAS